MTLTTINLAALGQTVNLGTEVTGTLPTGNGGTGSTATTFVNAATNVTGTLATANGGTGSTATTFVNAATNVTGTLPVANGGTAITSGFVNGAGTAKGVVGSYTMAFCNNNGGVSGNTDGTAAGTTAGTNLRVDANNRDQMYSQKSFSSAYWNFSGTWRNMSSSSLERGGDGTNMPNGLWVRTV